MGVIGVLLLGSSPVVGYIIHPDSWGKGYATEALQGLLAAWWALPLEEKDAGDGDGLMADGDAIFAETEKENAGSGRVLMKCGFQAIDEFFDDGVLVVLWKLERSA
jgi:RimJ/RimL family protein N-acetyltransferase